MNLPFDLEKALAGEPVVTRDGRRVTNIRALHIKSLLSILGLINGIAETFTIEGKYFDDEFEYDEDLFMLNTTPDDNTP